MKVGLGALVDACVELCAWRVERQDAEAARTFVRFGPIGFLVHDRLAGLQVDLDGALHARPVAREELFGGSRVQPA